MSTIIRANEMLKIGAIEDAVIDALKEADVEKLCRKISTVDDMPDVEDLQKLALDFPAIYVMFGERRGEREGPAGAAAFEYEIMVLIGARSLRTKTAASRDKGGAYDLIDAVGNALRDNNLGLEISPLEEVSVGLELKTSTAAIYSMSFVFEEIQE